jgi:hypothetical protein
MQKETLTAVKNLIISELDKANIDIADKVELMINIPKFLDEYDENIKVLCKHSQSNKRRTKC